MAMDASAFLFIFDFQFPTSVTRFGKILTLRQKKLKSSGHLVFPKILNILGKVFMLLGKFSLL